MALVHKIQKFAPPPLMGKNLTWGKVPLKLVHFSPFFGQILLIYLILDLKEFELYFPVEKNKRKRDPILPPSGKVGWMDLGRRFPGVRAYAAYDIPLFFE